MMKWTKIDDCISRCRVPWGWLVMHQSDAITPVNKGYTIPVYETGYEWRTAITFVFDPFHMWKA